MDVDKESSLLTYSNETKVDKPFFLRENPILLKNFVGKFMRVETKEMCNYSGYVYTIDPISGSIILLDVSEEGEHKSIKIIPGSTITGANAILDVQPLSDEVLLESICHEEQNDDFEEETILLRKQKVLQWFQQHFIPIAESSENSGVLVVMNELEIRPPYNEHTCFCGNEIVLGKTQGLLKAMPPAIE